MYYVNEEQIAIRLQTIPAVAEALNKLSAEWSGTLIEGLAQERALHLAIETVTDVGSFLIDGFILRDASSYEDIIDIIGEAGAFPEHLSETLTELVKLRKPLVQDYFELDRTQLHPLTGQLGAVLHAFKDAVEQYLKDEL
ncbi:DUF86 domain-containing protein [Paenibacillus protaetiae]|uniref:DUF86 domain-containing protein n=1 Tax=Paenibacillus protaetiae TaxID=2509456 RepID=A0A4P6EU55_9BACL|nr:HepT-like ribonuclease domain-containing protein [Paenibacillus protaetiae]QAY66444.1 DUF86 domain-containing protein [Paenibacillus protaetiae]